MAPVFISRPAKSPADSPALPPTLAICDFLFFLFIFFAVRAFFCNEGVGGGFRSVSWIYRSKSKATFASLSWLATITAVSRGPSWVFSPASTSLYWLARRPEPLNLRRWGAAAALDTGFPSESASPTSPCSPRHTYTDFSLPVHPPAKSLSSANP